MNIFVLHTKPRIAARMMCDKHIPKMIVESCQMLASALRANGAEDDDMPLTIGGTPYKNAHPKHPATIWAGMTMRNYSWLCTHADELTKEFSKRYGKTHGCEPALRHLIAQGRHFIPGGTLTPFALCMPDELKTDAPVQSYRSFYYADKKEFARWERGSPAPKWWPNKEE